jgi:Lipopolysaccharide-assembly
MKKILPPKRIKLISLRPALFCSILLLLTLEISSCGYSNPYVKKTTPGTPAKTLLITTWQNRTNELGLESVYFRLFNAWFKNSSRINVVFDEDQADLKLTGEISAIDLPGLFYGPSEEALEIKLKLTVRFTLRDNRNNSVLWQEKQYTFYEPFIIDPSGEKAEFNKQRALLRIGDEIAELIYLRTNEIVNNLSR